MDTRNRKCSRIRFEFQTATKISLEVTPTDDHIIMVTLIMDTSNKNIEIEYNG